MKKLMAMMAAVMVLAAMTVTAGCAETDGTALILEKIGEVKLGESTEGLEPLKNQIGELTLGTEAGLTGETHPVMTGGATLTLHGELIPILGEDTFGFGKLVNLDLNFKSLESLTAGIREDGARDIGSGLQDSILTENVSDLVKPE